MSQYLVMTPLLGCKKSSFAVVDRTLDAIDTDTVIDFTLTSADVRDDHKACARYLELLEALDRPSTYDGAEEPEDPVFYGVAPPTIRLAHFARSRQMMRDPSAGDVLHDLRQIPQSLTGRCLMFTIRVFAADESTARLVASIMAESCFEEGSFTLWVPPSQPGRVAEDVAGAKQVAVVPVPILEMLYPEGIPLAISGLRRIGNVASVQEFEGLSLLPVATCSSPRTIRRDTDPPAVDPAELLVIGHQVGFDDTETASRYLPPRGIRLSDLVMHVLGVGAPGSGKTSTSLGMVVTLWNNWGIPSLVIECAKAEYRALLTLRKNPDRALRAFGEAVRFYSPGSGYAAAYRHNALIIPEGVTIDQQVQTVARSFKAGMALSGPMLPLLTESLYRLYDRFQRFDYPPTLDDLVPVMEEVLREKRYGTDLEADILGALSTRVTSLLLGEMGRVQRTSVNIPDTASLFQFPTVIELNELDPDQVCAISFAILGEIRQHAKHLPYDGNRPKLFVVIEEAHVIAPCSRGTVPSEDNPDPGSFSSDLLCGILTECRALGISVMICNQLMSDIDPRLSKIPATTIGYRQKDGQERDILSPSMLLGAVESDDLVRLPAGTAYLMTPGYQYACRIRTPNTKKDLGIEEPPQGEAIIPYIIEAPRFRESLSKRLLGEMGVFSGRLGTFEGELVRASNALVELMEKVDAVSRNLVKPCDEAAVLGEVRRACSQFRAREKRLSQFFERMKRLFTLVVPGALPDPALGSEAEQEWVSLRERWALVCGHVSALGRAIQGLPVIGRS
jgi:hypothetical protein